MKSSSVRPNSLNTCIPRDMKPKNMAEKMQITASPSAKAPLRRKIKTPGRWDAVMIKIENSKTFNDNKIHKSAIKGKIDTQFNRSVVPNGSIPTISPTDEFCVTNDNNNSSHLRPSTPSLKSVSIPTMTKNNTFHSISSKVNIPKSKTFVRDTNGNNNNNRAGSRSQQPVPASEPSLPATPMTPQPPLLPINDRNGSQIIRNDRGVVASINDKKTSNRRPISATNTVGSSLPSKRMTNTKISASNTNPSKREIRSTQSAEDKQQIQKLTQLCESKTKQLKNLDINQNYMRLAFDSLAVVIQHLIEQFEPFENPKLKNALEKANQRCEQLKDDLDAKDVELNDMKLIFEEQINQLMKEREKNFSDLNQAKVSHESSIKKLKEMHSIEVKKIEDKYEKQLFKSQQNCNQLLNEIQEKTIELNETKQMKETLEIKTKQMEDNIMNDKDKKFKYLAEKSKQLELEVDSLKAVMDMKNEKIHSLERKMIETQEKINELPTAKESVRSLQQHVETLQITLDRKIHQFNELTRRHEDLKSLFDKEMREKRRLSMKNEELVYHLSESYHESNPGLNNSTNFFDGHPFKSPAPAVRVLHNDETPIKVNRSISINSGHAPVAFARKSHSKVNRSVSVSTTSSNSSNNTTSMIYCPSSGSECENHFNNITNNELSDNEVFDSGTSFSDSHRMPEPSNRKSVKVKRIERLSDETVPQSIFDSGFEDIQGLYSLPK